MAKPMDIISPDKKLDTTDEEIIALYKKGVTIERIFGVYYTLDEQANNGGLLTIGDAELAGKTPHIPNQPLERQPF